MLINSGAFSAKEKKIQTLLNNLYHLSLFSFIVDIFIELETVFLRYLATPARERSYVS